MKIGQRGMSTSAIVAIVVTVVVVVVVVSVAAVLLIGGGGGVGVGSLPKYTGATKYTGTSLGDTSSFLKAGVGRENSGSISDEPQGLDDELYVTPATTTSVSDVMSWYKTNMASQGWTLVYEENYSYSYMGFSMSWGLLYFDKGDRSAAVVVAEYEGEIYFALVEGPDSLFDPWMDYAGYEWEEPSGGTPGGGGIGSATSLSFNASGTTTYGSFTSTIYMKNIGQPTAKIRMDMTTAGVEAKVIIDAGANELWLWSAGTGWQDMSDYISPETYTSMTQGYTTQLSDWTGGNYTYTDPTTGTTVTISNIQVNPVLADSLFQH